MMHDLLHPASSASAGVSLTLPFHFTDFYYFGCPVYISCLVTGQSTNPTDKSSQQENYSKAFPLYCIIKKESFNLKKLWLLRKNYIYNILFIIFDKIFYYLSYVCESKVSYLIYLFLS